MYLSLQNCAVFVIYCVGVKLWKHINIGIVFVLFVIYMMYAVQKREKDHRTKQI